DRARESLRRDAREKDDVTLPRRERRHAEDLEVTALGLVLAADLLDGVGRADGPFQHLADFERGECREKSRLRVATRAVLETHALEGDARGIDDLIEIKRHHACRMRQAEPRP